MSSKVDICNMALGHLKVPSIQSLDETSMGARQCSLYFDTVSRGLQEEYEWTFNLLNRSLVLHSSSPAAGWSVRYMIPSDCVRVRRVLVSTSMRTDQPIPYELQYDGNDYTLLCDVEDAILQYSFFHQITAKWSSLFCLAISWSLASEIALALTENQTMRAYCRAQYMMAASRAMAADSAQRWMEPPSSPLANSRL